MLFNPQITHIPVKMATLSLWYDIRRNSVSNMNGM